MVQVEAGEEDFLLCEECFFEERGKIPSFFYLPCT
jgi:hypothetical protein